jgi:DNA-binding YbaB/EbfC family protein
MDMKKMMKQAQKMQAELAKAQEEVTFLTAEATVGGGAVKVVANGDGSIQSIAIDPDAVDPGDVEMLQDLVLTAVNEALHQVQELASTRLNAVTGGLGLPF